MPALQEVYARLLSEIRPSVIENDAQYNSISKRFSGLVRKGRGRTPDETKLMKLLAVLVRDYDQRNGQPPAKVAAEEAIQFLLEHSGRTPTDLLYIFGQRSHVNEALSGRRKISADQARKLGKLFNVNPGVFI